MVTTLRYSIKCFPVSKIDNNNGVEILEELKKNCQIREKTFGNLIKCLEIIEILYFETSYFNTSTRAVCIKCAVCS